MHDKPSICAQCAGKCCKGMPGSAFPSDFGLPDTTRLVAALRSGRYAIDWWEGDPRIDGGGDLDMTAYYLRPAIKGSEGRLRHASWGGECTFLTPLGCSLKSDDRPTECRHLVPNLRFECGFKEEGKWDKRAAAVAWLPFNDVLEGLISSLTVTT